MNYTVGETAKIMNLPTSTLRYYDKIGLLPFVKRTESGIRMFQDEDMEWLGIIECLKKTGMQLTEIREYINMAMLGDETIDARLQMFLRRKQETEQQIKELQETLETIDYKIWFYETAKEKGTTKGHCSANAAMCRKKYREVKQRLAKNIIIKKQYKIFKKICNPRRPKRQRGFLPSCTE
ncbi:MAG: MerR family transcriptional regulator [Anaerotruncus sp.]|nr:MAG: MerR family transcriptional regulator [Anaerotruncus sp.]